MSIAEIGNDLEQLKASLERQRQLKNPGIILSKRDPAKKLAEIRQEIGECQRCNLHKTRNKMVFGAGDPKADLMFVGEAPGRDEDREGEPFVGRAGQLLTKIIAAIGKTRDQVYIANILKCHPPGNRNPESKEISICAPFLDLQIEAIQPKVICALGTFAAHTMLNTTTPISALRGQTHPYKDYCLLVPTFHPAYLLRSPSKKKEVWEDMQIIMRLLE